MSNIYIATAIPYVNGAPHLGHAMDYLLADVYRRYSQAQGNNVRLQAGTDEHGNKVFKKAAETGQPVQVFADQNAKKFQDFTHRLDVEYTDFIRTTDPDHIRRCQAIWQKLAPYIYKGTYEGWYCEGCEGFATQTEYDENHGICPDHNKPYIRLSEENYYLKVSAFTDRIKQAIKTKQMQIIPEFRAKEFLNLLDTMPDVSISRPKEHLSWGVPVPDDENQIMYVWIDALANYITILGYPDQDISDWWPAKVQVIGKDILRFHAGIWPAILMGLDLPLPEVLLTHGHITVDGSKMSKSIGNVVDPIEVLNKHGVEPFRYFFLRHVPTTDDADFSWDRYESAYNELANDLGNLVQRLATMCQKYSTSGQKPDHTIADKTYTDMMNKYDFSAAFSYAWSKIQNINKAIDDSKPWEIAKNGDTTKLKTTMDNLVSSLLSANQLLLPFLPQTNQTISNIFSAETIIPPESPLFPKH